MVDLLENFQPDRFKRDGAQDRFVYRPVHENEMNNGFRLLEFIEVQGEEHPFAVSPDEAKNLTRDVFQLKRTFGESEDVLQGRARFAERRLQQMSRPIAYLVCAWLFENVRGWPAPDEIARAEAYAFGRFEDAMTGYGKPDKLAAIRSYKREIKAQERDLRLWLQNPAYGVGYAERKVSVGVDPGLLEAARVAHKAQMESTRQAAY